MKKLNWENRCVINLASSNHVDGLTEISLSLIITLIVSLIFVFVND